MEQDSNVQWRRQGGVNTLELEALASQVCQHFFEQQITFFS